MPTLTPHNTTNTRRAFTLVELLTVIGIIGVLATILLVAGASVIRAQKASQTKGLLETLDRALDEYRHVYDRYPNYSRDRYAELQAVTNGGNYDTFAGESHPKQPEFALFYLQTRGVGVVDSLLQALPGDLVRTIGTLNDGTELVRVVDAWGTPILYIHPENDLAQGLYGTSPNKRPYFLSAGPDRLYGLTEEQDATFTLEDAIKAMDDNLTSIEVGPFDRSTGSVR